VAALAIKCKFCSSEGLNWKVDGVKPDGSKNYKLWNPRANAWHSCSGSINLTDPAVNTGDASNGWHERAEAIEAKLVPLEEQHKQFEARVLKLHDESQKAKEAIGALAAAISARRIVRVVNERNGKTLELEGLVHKDFEEALQVLLEDGCIWLYGGAGTFKTSTARLFAKAIFPDRAENERFFPQSVNRQTTKSDLVGYTTADGRFVESPLYRARKFGGVYLMDEVDAANENSLTAINASVENDVVLFPNGELVEKHSEFYVVACGNTVGKGGDAQFVGRNVIDGATISRFPFFHFDADWGMTREICATIAGEDGEKWAEYVMRVDERVQHLKIPHPIGPRAAVKGAKLLASGIPWERVEELRIFGSLKPDTVDVIKAAVTAGR